MLVTEEEAWNKVCPWMNDVKNLAEVSVDGSAPLYRPNNCSGSECMAWRWHQPKLTRIEHVKTIRATTGVSLDEALKISHAELPDLPVNRNAQATHGYCGNSGVPT